MSESTEAVRGACNCGAVTFRGELASDCVEVCHCSTCRKRGGGPFFSVRAEASMQFSGEALRVWRSSEWAERGFCGLCGSNLFYRMREGGMTMIAASLIDGIAPELEMEIFYDSKPSYYELVEQPGVRRLTGEETVALFTGSAS